MILALIMWGVVPVRPAATIMMYSSTVAWVAARQCYPQRRSCIATRLDTPPAGLAKTRRQRTRLATLDDRTALGHLVGHDDQQVEASVSGLFVHLLGAKHRFRKQFRDQLEAVGRDDVDDRRDTLQAVLLDQLALWSWDTRMKQRVDRLTL